MAGLFKEGWRWAFWGVAALCGLQIALLPSFAHESPVWLLARDAESARARHVLCELRGFAPGGAPLRDEVRLYRGKSVADPTLHRAPPRWPAGVLGAGGRLPIGCGRVYVLFIVIVSPKDLSFLTHEE